MFGTLADRNTVVMVLEVGTLCERLRKCRRFFFLNLCANRISLAKMAESKTKYGISARCFNNRSQSEYTSEQVAELWTQYAWCVADGDLIRQPDLDHKAGKGNEMWRMKIAKHPPVPKGFTFDRVVPCKALVAIKMDDQIYHFNASYKTVSVEACPSAGGMALIDFRKSIERPNVSSLKRSLWVVSPVAAVRFMIHLKRNDGFDPMICKDDASGEVFPYLLSSVYVVKKAALVQAPLAASASATATATATATSSAEG